MGIYRARMRRTSKGRRDPQRLTVEGDSLFLNLESEGREANTHLRELQPGGGVLQEPWGYREHSYCPKHMNKSQVWWGHLSIISAL